MDPKLILDALLERSQQATSNGLELAEHKLGVEGAEQRTAMLKGLGTGAAAAGALALLIGSKSGRKFTKKAVKLGGVAAIGTLAWKAYNDWQAQSGASGQAGGGASAAGPGTPIGELSGPQADRRGEALIRAMISAARSDGHMDERERELIAERLKGLGLEQDFAALLMAEMSEPVSAARVAGFADSDEARAEIYLASSMVIDRDDTAGAAYLDELAEALALHPNVRALLDAPLGDA